MAQSGYTPLLIYSSSTTGNTPSASNLTNSSLGSELAINIYDGKLFYKDNSGVVQTIASKAISSGNFPNLSTTGTFSSAAGTALLPSIYFSTYTTSGFYSSTANVLGIAISASSIGTFTSTGLNGMAIGATTASSGVFTSLSATGNNATVTLSPTGGSGRLILASPTANATPGSMDNVTIGATTAGIASFTTLSASSTVSLSGASASVTLSPSGGSVTISPAYNSGTTTYGTVTINPQGALNLYSGSGGDVSIGPNNNPTYQPSLVMYTAGGFSLVANNGYKSFSAGVYGGQILGGAYGVYLDNVIIATGTGSTPQPAKFTSLTTTSGGLIINQTSGTGLTTSATNIKLQTGLTYGSWVYGGDVNNNVFAGVSNSLTNIVGSSNVWVGSSTPQNATTSIQYNTIVGTGSGTTGNFPNMTYASYNVIMGNFAGRSIQANSYCVLIGQQAGYNIKDTSGFANSTYQTFVGAYAGYGTTTGPSNTAFGAQALYTGGSSTGKNTAIGALAGYSSTGDSQTLVGYSAGQNLSNTGLTLIGNYIGSGTAPYTTTTSLDNAFVMSDGRGYVKCWFDASGNYYQNPVVTASTAYVASESNSTTSANTTSNSQTYSITFNSSQPIFVFYIYSVYLSGSLGDGVFGIATQASGTITLLNSSSVFVLSASPTANQIGISKSANSNVITIKTGSNATSVATSWSLKAMSTSVS